VKTKNLEFIGQILAIQPNANYTVKVKNKMIEFVALCYLCGKMTKNFINPDIGDSVKIEVSPLDLHNMEKIKGRIVQRLK
jgi:translation initiation factor IF-1